MNSDRSEAERASKDLPASSLSEIQEKPHIILPNQQNSNKIEERRQSREMHEVMLLVAKLRENIKKFTVHNDESQSHSAAAPKDHRDNSSSPQIEVSSPEEREIELELIHHTTISEKVNEFLQELLY